MLATLPPREDRDPTAHGQGETRALIGAHVEQGSLSVTADTCTHVLLDDRELDHSQLVAELAR